MGKILLSIIFVVEILRRIQIDLNKNEKSTESTENITTQEETKEMLDKMSDLADRLPPLEAPSWVEAATEALLFFFDQTGLTPTQVLVLLLYPLYEIYSGNLSNSQKAHIASRVESNFNRRYPNASHLPERDFLREQFAQSGGRGGGPVFSRARSVPRNIPNVPRNIPNVPRNIPNVPRNIPSRSNIPHNPRQNTGITTTTRITTTRANRIQHVTIPAVRYTDLFNSLERNYLGQQQLILDSLRDDSFQNSDFISREAQVTILTLNLMSNLNRINSFFVRIQDNIVAQRHAVYLVNLYILEIESLYLDLKKPSTFIPMFQIMGLDGEPEPTLAEHPHRFNHNDDWVRASIPHLRQLASEGNYNELQAAIENRRVFPKPSEIRQKAKDLYTDLAMNATSAMDAFSKAEIENIPDALRPIAKIYGSFRQVVPYEPGFSILGLDSHALVQEYREAVNRGTQQSNQAARIALSHLLTLDFDNQESSDSIREELTRINNEILSSSAINNNTISMIDEFQRLIDLDLESYLESSVKDDETKT